MPVTSDVLPVNSSQAPAQTVATSLAIASPRYPDPRSIPSIPVQGDVRSSVLGVPWKHLTQAERKRVEWERQRLEEQELQRQVGW